MIRAGVDVFRINGSYEDPAHHAKTIGRIRNVSHGKHTSTAVLVDLPGPKFRLGQLSPNETTLKKGAHVSLICGNSAQKDSRIPVPDRAIARSVKPGNTVFINDGLVELRVLEVKGMEVRCQVKAGGPIRSGKGLNLPRVPLKLPSLTPRDREMAAMAIRQDADYVGLSFVRSAKNIKDLRSIFKKKASHIGIIAKIEKPEALDDLDNIIDVSDAIMVARGDLGIEMPFDQIPIIQKHIIQRCTAAGKAVITATQMLESMVSSSRPTRAEATDVALAVWEGTDAVMLSEETSVGINPAKAVQAMAHIAFEAEKVMPECGRIEKIKGRKEMQALALSEAASFLAEELDAKAIVTPTRSGRTALYVSRGCPDAQILAPTPDIHTARRMALYRGVIPMPMPTFSTVDEMLVAAGKAARKSRYIKKGDTVVITSGAHGGKDDITKLVEVRTV
jgi:pyruvate kinase